MLTFADSLAATKQQDTTEEIRAIKKATTAKPHKAPIFHSLFYSMFFIAASIRCLTKSLNT